MKKLYTLALAAAVAAPSVATPRSASVSQSSLVANTAKYEMLSKAVKGTDIHKAPANVPASLEDNAYIFSFGMDYTEYTHETSYVEFEYVKSDAASGYDLYTMYGFMDGIFSNLTVEPLSVLYSTATGELVIPAGQKLTELNGTDCTIWNISGNSAVPNVEFLLKWDGKGFVWSPTVTVVDETGATGEYKSDGMFIGYIKDNTTGQLAGLFVLDNFAINAVNGALKFSFTREGQTIESGSDLSVSEDGNTVTIRNFADMATLTCTLDTEAKTLTAENAILTQVNMGTDKNPVIADAYISEAENDGNFAYNAAGDGVYKLVMTYTTANGKTQVTMPDWNAFVLDGRDDLEVLPIISKSSMTFDFELGSATQGVSDIITDDSDAPVEYFNLQGVRVANPENGLYIRRQGSKAQKVLVK